MRPDWLVHGWPVSLDDPDSRLREEPYTPEFWRAYLAAPRPRRPFWRHRELVVVLVLLGVLAAVVVRNR